MLEPGNVTEACSCGSCGDTVVVVMMFGMLVFSGMLPSLSANTIGMSKMLVPEKSADGFETVFVVAAVILINVGCCWDLIIVCGPIITEPPEFDFCMEAFVVKIAFLAVLWTDEGADNIFVPVGEDLSVKTLPSTPVAVKLIVLPDDAVLLLAIGFIWVRTVYVGGVWTSVVGSCKAYTLF